MSAIPSEESEENDTLSKICDTCSNIILVESGLPKIYAGVVRTCIVGPQRLNPILRFRGTLFVIH